MLRPNDTQGKLIIVEGIDGSGKSTQIDLLFKWLQSQGRSVYFSEWNSSELVKSTTKAAKKAKTFTPTTFSILACTDFADRWENSIYPLLKAGVIVLADRYAYTAFARDVARGLDPGWVRNMYSFAIQPDAALFFRVPLEVAVGRIMAARAELKYYEAGMDVGLSDNVVESFKLFQGKILDEYNKMVDEFGLGSTENLRELMKTIREENIVGGLMWSIRGHRRDGGWYYHNEGGTTVNSFHVPGFTAGYVYEETRLLDLLRTEAFLIRGIEPEPVAKPTPAPVLMQKGDGFTWRGSTGAASYTIERAENADGPWKVLAVGLEDSVIADVTNYEHTPQASEATILYYDESRKPGIKYFYRLKGSNVAGDSGFSNVLEIK